MDTILSLIQAVCALAAAAIIGNWYLSEFKKRKAAGKPWYDIYLSPPGILVAIVIMVLPLILIVFN